MSDARVSGQPQPFDLTSLVDAIGLGVAGNFAGHLEQAGEARDFAHAQTLEPDAPKGIFPFYVPGAAPHFLGTFPLSDTLLVLPEAGQPVQLEPELALVCELTYSQGRVTALSPRAFGAFDDSSIRRPDAHKISEKKNWGACTKGLSTTLLPLADLHPGGPLDAYRLASFLWREGELLEYGVDSAIASYSYFHDPLLSWLVDRMNHQVDAGALESIAAWLARAGQPCRAVVSVGSTRYTPFGEAHFMQPGDEAIVAVYDARRYDAATLAHRLRHSGPLSEGLSVLRRRVVAATATPVTARPPAP